MEFSELLAGKLGLTLDKLIPLLAVTMLFILLSQYLALIKWARSASESGVQGEGRCVFDIPNVLKNFD
jgi:hypothetical protein